MNIQDFAVDVRLVLDRLTFEGTTVITEVGWIYDRTAVSVELLRYDQDNHHSVDFWIDLPYEMRSDSYMVEKVCKRELNRVFWPRKQNGVN